MKYLKTFEASNHWVTELYDKVKFERTSDLEDLTYSFVDSFGMKSNVSTNFNRNGFESVGSLKDYLLDGNNLYKNYTVNIHNYLPDSLDIDSLLQFKEYEIEILNRLKSEGYIFKYGVNKMNEIFIDIYHPDDIIDKDLFLNDFKNARSRSKEKIYKHLVENFGKISNISKTVSGTIIMDIDPSSKYTINDLLIFVKASLKHTKQYVSLSIELVNKYKDKNKIKR